MIAVIADDLTGAAELAGIGLNYHLKTEIDTIVDTNSNADLLIIATDTRSLPAAEAKQVITDLTRQLMQLQPKLIFKKIDSVLRGNVLDEINSQLEASGLQRALIVPGNPLHGKTIVDGIYYYQDKPVHLSNYANDPGFPVTSSDVKTMLRANGSIQLLKNHQQLPSTGIIVGEVAVEADFNRWVEKLDNKTLIAGAAGLFNSLLNYLKPTVSADDHPEKTFNTPRLFVFGSTFNKDGHNIKNGLLNNIPVLYIPAEIIFGEKIPAAIAENYVQQIITVLKEKGNCIMAIHPNATSQKSIEPCTLTNKMGFLVNRVHQQITLHELLIEGGATATAVLQHMHISKLTPVKQMAPGVICTSVPGNQLYVTLKPGSYQWPAIVWQPANLPDYK
ncbi:four-carbon acid sugar kinase family protein [Mucilaginibacter boryungensis]|uniref:Four-carbon acid sugar kinase family protein n=1 Tax=Mucilaginibacter boryungensis TaxID=768480 RepID=A0ABR9XE80_9SPHI|nr:four-carbon acid sugar kinase family protein [Mucilaginibacter boryungensis]MBE9665284.1 four-carbon acid sugar kinase family protein [Mucilaginibacter boryungensis]